MPYQTPGRFEPTALRASSKLRALTLNVWFEFNADFHSTPMLISTLLIVPDTIPGPTRIVRVEHTIYNARARTVVNPLTRRPIAPACTQCHMVQHVIEA